MNENDCEKIGIKYSKSRDFRTITANGAWGGITPQGEILCGLYVEHSQIPENVSISIDKNTGMLKDETIKDSIKAFERELQIAVILRPDIAKVIGEWLIKQSDSVIFLKGKQNII